MDKIVFVMGGCLTITRDKRFQVSELAKKGFEVQWWDLSQYLERNIRVVDKIESELVTKINTFKDFKNKLKNTDIKKTAFIVQVPLKIGAGKIYNLMHKMGCYKIHLEIFTPPFTHVEKKTNKERVKYLSSLFFSKDISKAFSKVYYRIYVRLNHMQYECRMSSNKYGMRTASINHIDYDDYITMDSTPIVDGKYICFCDKAFPMHGEIPEILNGVEMPDAKIYRDSLNKFFNYVEEKFKMPVVIAEHPAAGYDGSEFEGRRIIRGKTGNLIRNSSITLMHFSNAISFVVLADIPVCFFTTDGFDSIQYFRDISRKIVSSVNKEIYNIDSCRYEDILFGKIESGIRERCKYDYLTTHETENIKNIDILDKFIREL